MFEGYKRKKMKKMARKLLESEQGKVALQILTTAERTLLQSVREQREAMGLDGDLDELPSKEDRAEQIRQLALAAIADEVPRHYVETYLRDRLDHVDEAAEYADLDEDEWVAQKERWADQLRAQGATGSDEALAARFVEMRYDVPIEEFYQFIVDWPESREAQEIEAIVTSGLKSANQTINAHTEILEEADVDVGDAQGA
ncbi:hypothetical protein [Halapricum desulfuricans]|uniref:Uncharacterized protein n=1 Tax=Halapricum desulfuricans TaxID=2841257 RepID=A0A897N1S1_9EURY|nr:hypothetical protein [Halapricum desulfuricans]QSG06461.1 Uncharacterized protein HSR121_2130 [Halapricum desulfuricans]